jgi:hypothetical protein
LRSARDALRLAIEVGELERVPRHLRRLAEALAVAGAHAAAARLYGAYDARVNTSPSGLPEWERAYAAQTRETLRNELGAAYQALVDEGAALDVDGINTVAFHHSGA